MPCSTAEALQHGRCICLLLGHPCEATRPAQSMPSVSMPGRDRQMHCEVPLCLQLKHSSYDEEARRQKTLLRKVQTLWEHLASNSEE
jgi:hypothetical protein